MAKAKNTTVEVAKAASAPTAPTCSNCTLSVGTGWGLLCGAKLPPWVKRSEKPVDNIVRPHDVCDLHKPE